MYTEKFNTIKGWKTMTLTPKETKEVKKAYRAYSKLIMEECIDDAKKLEKNKVINHRIAIALFQVRCPKLYTLMQNRLQDKIYEFNPKNFITQNLEDIKKIKEESDKI